MSNKYKYSIETQQMCPQFKSQEKKFKNNYEQNTKHVCQNSYF